MARTAVKTAWTGVLIGVLVAGLAGVAPGGAKAQGVGMIQSDIVVLDPDRLFAQTEVGQRLTAQYEAERDRLIANNRDLEAQLRAEEQALTDARETMTPEDFRAKADAFDTKVRSIRQENERKARDLEHGREIAPRRLMRMAEPVLVQLMRDTGARIIMDNRQLLLRADAIDITDLAITRIDAAIGDGSDLSPKDDGALTPGSADTAEDGEIDETQPRPATPATQE